jgi:hypothetical protein
VVEPSGFRLIAEARAKVTTSFLSFHCKLIAEPDSFYRCLTSEFSWLRRPEVGSTIGAQKPKSIIDILFPF